jgi:NYN domain
VKTFVYIDGFNLYHGCVKYSAHKWVNLRRLAENLLPGHCVEMVKFFTARVSASIGDPDQPNRQMVYWRALRTLKRFEIVEGTFYEHAKSMPLASACHMHTPGVVTLVRVMKKEEKGSDVNIAAHLLMDGWKKRYEQAVVVTNDSDLATPIAIVRGEMKLPVGILNPHEFHSKKLRNLASFLGRIRESDLANAQFENELKDSKGTFRKPDRWNKSSASGSPRP